MKSVYCFWFLSTYVQNVGSIYPFNILDLFSDICLDGAHALYRTPYRNCYTHWPMYTNVITLW